MSEQSGFSAATFQRQRAALGYPDVPLPAVRNWNVPNPGYRPVYYTADAVKQVVPDWNAPDVATAWRRTRALTHSMLWRDEDTGLALNPDGATGITGFGNLPGPGPHPTAEMLVQHTNRVLLIENSETGQLAFPGGLRGRLRDVVYEDPLSASVRRVHEMTGVRLRSAAPREAGRLRGDARLFYRGVGRLALCNTDLAWIETAAYHIDISSWPIFMFAPVKPARDKAAAATWHTIDTVDVTRMSFMHGWYMRGLQGKA